MAKDVHRVVEIISAPIINCSGLAKAEIIDSNVHLIFFQTLRDGIELKSPIVHAINLTLVIPTDDALEAVRILARTLGLRRPRPKKNRTP